MRRKLVQRHAVGLGRGNGEFPADARMASLDPRDVFGAEERAQQEFVVEQVATQVWMRLPHLGSERVQQARRRLRHLRRQARILQQREHAGGETGMVPSDQLLVRASHPGDAAERQRPERQVQATFRQDVPQLVREPQEAHLSVESGIVMAHGGDAEAELAALEALPVGVHRLRCFALLFLFPIRTRYSELIFLKLAKRLHEQALQDQMAER